MTSQVIHVPQAGKLEGGKLRIGSIVKGKLKLTQRRVALGDGIELDSEFSPQGVVWLSVTSAGAKRLGIPHPADGPKAPTAADVPKLQNIVTSDAYGQQERLTALRQIETVDPDLARALSGAYSWLEYG